MRESQRRFQYAHQRPACTALHFIVLGLQLLLRYFNIPVAVLVPHEAVDRARDVVRGQPAREDQADEDDPSGRGEEPDSECQLSASSNRYPTPQTVSMLGSVTFAAASFSRSCWTWTSTVRVYPGKS